MATKTAAEEAEYRAHTAALEDEFRKTVQRMVWAQEVLDRGKELFYETQREKAQIRGEEADTDPAKLEGVYREASETFPGIISKAKSLQLELKQRKGVIECPPHIAHYLKHIM